ncbi:MAG: sulfite exporter TauE/SafE family protein [Rhodomicrobium sp.]
MAQINIAFAFAGFLVGALVGFTGVGGGSLMTPILIVIFGVHPLSAVGTDLLFAAVTKTAGARVHAFRGNVDWRVVGFLALGSVPGALGAVFVMARLPVHSPALANAITVAIGVALLLAAAGLLFGQTAGLFAANSAAKRPAPSARRGLTVFLGFLLGVLVSLTSVGAGAIGIVVLRLLYPQLPAVRLVGSDIAHAVPLALLAGSGHWLIGDVQWALLGSLLIGSIPGIIVSSCCAHRVPEGILRRGLGVILLVIAAPILMSQPH